MSVSVVTRPIEAASGNEWSAAHLPIVYELSNNYFPTNSVDTTRTISSEANDLGFMKLNLSGSLGTFEALDYVKISGADIPDGIYQILTKGSSSQITINYPYESIANTGNVILYKNNYHVLVEVWVGRNAPHIWAILLPSALIATLKLVPNSANSLKFSINELVKTYLSNQNLLVGTMPNNIVASTEFYIKYAESYDVSDGDVVETFTSSYTSDKSTLTGFAANSKLPFKNSHSGWMTDYISTPRKFLTLFDEMYVYPGNYMDIGFLVKKDDPSMYFIRKRYVRGVYIDTDFSPITTVNNPGVFRWPLSQVGSEDKQEVFLATGIQTTPAPSAWTNGFGIYDPFDVANATNFSQGTFGSGGSYMAYVALSTPLINGRTPKNFNLEISGLALSGSDLNIGIALLDGADPTGSVRWNSEILIPSGSGSFSGTYSTNFQNTGAGDSNLMLIVVLGVPGDSIDIRMVSEIYDYDQISETKIVNIVTDCANQSLNVAWLNYLGAFDWHVFTTRKTYSIDTSKTQTKKRSIFNNWPDSYGSAAETIEEVTKRDSKNVIEVSSQYITNAQEDAIKYIMTSPMVQIVNSTADKRTVLVQNTTLPIRRDMDKLKRLSFILEYTDEIPSQSL